MQHLFIVVPVYSWWSEKELVLQPIRICSVGFFEQLQAICVICVRSDTTWWSRSQKCLGKRHVDLFARNEWITMVSGSPLLRWLRKLQRRWNTTGASLVCGTVVMSTNGKMKNFHLNHWSERLPVDNAVNQSRSVKCMEHRVFMLLTLASQNHTFQSEFRECTDFATDTI